MPLSRLLKTSDRKLKAELQLVLNAVVDGLCGLDAGGNVTFCNVALLKMTGYRTDEMIGKNLHELLHHSRPDGTKYPAEECAVRQAMAAHQAIHIAGEFLWRKDGTCFPMECRMHALPEPSSLTAYVATIQDTTGIERDKDALRRSEEKFRGILASFPDVAWTADRDGRTKYISPKAEAIFGYTKQEICAGGANLWLGRIHAEDFGRVKEAYGALFEKQSPFDQEYRIRRKDGVWIWVHDRATATREENGILYADGILSDITRRKQAEAELQSQTALLEAQANSTIDGMLVVDGCGQRLMQNQKFVDLFKIPSDVLADKDDRRTLEYAVTLIKDPKPFVARIQHLNRHPRETSRDEVELKDGMILDRYSAPVVDKNGIYYGRIWTFRDITDRRRNEDVLQQLSMAVEQSPVSVIITDPQGNISYVNRKFTECTGYGPEEAVGKNPRILKSGCNSPHLYRDLWSTITQGRAWHGELCNKKKNGDIYWEAATITPITNPKGAITHFLSVQEDITERRRAEKELRLTKSSLENASDAVFWIDPQAHIVYVNEAACRSLGRSREELLSLSIPDIDPLFPKETWGPFWKECRKRGSMTFETQHQAKEGRIFPVEVTANYVEFDGQEYSFAFVRNITERRRAEEALKASEKRYRLLFERNLAGVLRTTLEGRVLECNQATARILGYDSPEEVLLLPATSLYHQLSDREVFLTKLKSEKSVTNHEMRFRRKDGESAWVIASFSLVDDDSTVGGMIEGTLVDITERKRAEEKVREGNETVRILLDSIPEAVYGIDRQGKCTFCNPSCLELLGYEEAADLLGKNMHALIHHTRADGTPYPVEECHIYEAFRREHGTHIDNEVLWRRDRTSFSAEYWSHPMQRGGKVVGTVVTFVDITKRRLTQEALRESERRYRLLFERNMAGVFRTTLEGRVLECNPAAAHLFGCDSPEELLTLPITTFYRMASDREALLTKLNSEKSVTNHEMRFQRKNGDPAWAMLNLSLVDDDSGAGRVIEGTFVDITERKQAEEEVYQSSQMLQSILDAIPQRVFWKDRNSTYLGCNRAFATDAGLEAAAAIIGKNDFDLAWSQTAPLYRADDKLVMERGTAKLNFEERQSRPDGSMLWLQTNKLPLRDREGKVTGVIGTYEDITERKQAETELRMTQFSVEHASNAIEWVDSQSRILYVNEAACRALGHSREELLSLTIPDINPRFPRETWGGFWANLRSQGSMTFETQHRTKEGRLFPVEVTANYLEFDGQEYVFAFVLDTTERRALESQLRQAQKLEGIGQLAAGIAHEINTPTQFVTDNLTFLRDSWKAIYKLLELYRHALHNAAGTLLPGVTAALDEAERSCDLEFIVAEVPRAIDQSLDGAGRVAKIVRAMKDFSHPDSADKTATDLNRAIESTITVARNEWKYVAEIATEFDATLPPIVCYAGDINQVVLNLMVNAAHAIKEKVTEGEMGRITIGTRARASLRKSRLPIPAPGFPKPSAAEFLTRSSRPRRSAKARDKASPSPIA